MAVAFIFSGQGAQAVGMGKTLCENSAAAQKVFDQANDVLGWDLKSACFDGPAETLTETRVCQPALYVHGVAVVETLRERGKLPQVGGVAGLSLGELTALHAAGVFDFATGLQVVAERGRLMQEACEATNGGMTSLLGGDLQAAYDLARKHDVDVANLNCPGQTVLSGDKAKIAEAMADAQNAGFKRAIPLNVAGAYHSRLMQPAADAFAAYLADKPFATPQIPVFTNTTGQEVSNPDEIKQALVTQVVSAVRWEDCFRGLVSLGMTEFYECGPGATLAGLAKRIDRDAVVSSLGEFADLPL
ncbi:ACP S-malonyltransferase [Cerasicoccus arenae]|uniref:Malonyl CoA-acyl carrier protein transacylase n=1 Tax=Cerasicoccus arenae TaxID=424488 RepID=A0A8J3DB06_9BACT|nr:ACP S-malonyltransferase [Cerasicoccus arenae]MBK1856689.1 ACP S-malonyltransferase [Cerasicoccus arenae]GHB98922.1 malonyl CoA-acyl carrier protein transacylase [Cerasicoccus arenae]